MFRLSIVTPEKTFFDADVASLMVPGSEGYLGVLSNHAPLITALKPGRIEYKDADNNPRFVAVSGGFLEVSGNVATLLADAAEDTEEIDVERARAAYDRAWELLKEAGKTAGRVDVKRARLAMERASNRIKIYEEKHR
ncbi:MAG: F0F1 ATP synthase subunit epsilon [bacterium]|nr:F0F1 ATP synthase subunit epsilon [bacterium]